MKVRGLLGEKAISLRAKMVFHLIFVLSEDFKPPLSVFKEKNSWSQAIDERKKRKEEKRKERAKVDVWLSNFELAFPSEI